MSAPPSPSGHRGPLRQIAELPSFLAIVLLVVSSVLLYVLGGVELGARALSAIGLALASMVSQMSWLHWCKRPHRERPHVHLAIYFIVQLAMNLAAVALSGGHLTFIMLALASQAVLFWPWRWALPVLLAAFVGPLVVVALSHSEHLGGFVISYTSIGAFVVTFSSMLARQYDAREENARLASALSAANEELERNAGLVAEVATMRERERLAREIHDVLGHYLTAVHVHMRAAENLLDRDGERARGLIRKSRELTHQGLDELRRSLSRWRDTTERAPLDEVLRGLVESQSSPELAARLHVEGAPRRIDPARELAVYRGAQEALTNARRHSGASEVQFTLAFDERVRLTVEDNGRGSPAARAGNGLRGLAERLRQLGGDLEIDTERENGFRVVIEVPS